MVVPFSIKTEARPSGSMKLERFALAGVALFDVALLAAKQC